MRRLLPLLFLAGCDSVLPAGCPATEKAGFERTAGAHLSSCIQNNRYCNADITRACFVESERFCLANGWPKECGRSEKEASCGEGWPK